MKLAVPLLMDWYGVSKRSLPWRGTKDFYAILVSEIMLQQTRVEAVKGYYLRFLEKFPTAKELSLAKEEEVLKAWEGLGYYSRARNLQKAAKLFVEKGFPEDFEGVRALPGVGDYTAGAICSIAFDSPCPAVDGNVLRILTRLLADERNIDEPASRAYFVALLKEVYPKEAGDFCQALMELGALVCLPNGDPLCGECPWKSLCAAREGEKWRDLPVRREKKERKIEERFVYVLKFEEKFALRKRESGVLKGLFEFPNYLEEKDFGRVIKEQSAVHIFTHIEWKMKGFLVSAKERFPEFIWVSAEELIKDYPLPSAFKAFKKWVK